MTFTVEAYNAGDGEFRVEVASTRLSDPATTLQFNMTSEGLIVDLVGPDGEVRKSMCRMWDELEDLLQ